MMFSPLIYYSEERARTPSPTGPGPDRLCRYVISPATRVPLATPKCKVPRTEACIEVYQHRVQNRADEPRVGVKPYVSVRRRQWHQQQQQPVVVPGAELVAVAVLPPVPAQQRPVLRRPVGPVPQRSTAPPAVTITAQGPAVAPRNGHQLAVISSDRIL